MAKRKITPKSYKKNATSKKSKNSFFTFKKVVIFFLLIISLFFASMLYMLYAGKLVYVPTQKPTQKQIQKQDDIEIIKDKEILKKIKKLLSKQDRELAQKTQEEKNAQTSSDELMQKEVKDKDVKDKEADQEAQLEKQSPTEVDDFIKSVSVDKQRVKPRKKKVYKGMPKLAIIIDDVSFRAQVRRIKQIPYKVTPSFLPPTKRHPSTPTLAKEFKVYMVHLPMEAISFAHPEAKTLMVGDSYKRMKDFLTQSKKEFPKALYYNNHTGSKFTSNLRSMDHFFRALKEEKLKFVDSKTTSKSKANVVSKKYHIKLLERDIFLDNSFDKKRIKAQIKSAVKIAKKHGYAIAICHPHRATLDVLKNAKELLKGVKMVFIDEL